MNNLACLMVVAMFSSAPRAYGQVDSNANVKVAPRTPAEIAGEYAMANAPQNKVLLNADGTLALVQGGRSYTGTFTIDGNTLMVVGKGLQKSASIIQGDNILDANGSTWARQKAPGDPVAREVPNTSVEENVKARYRFNPMGATINPTAIETGTTLVVRRPGIMSLPLGQAIIPVSTYKLHEPGFGQKVVTNWQMATPLAPGERVHLVNVEMNVKGDSFTLVVFGCKACNGLYSRAAVTFAFSKGYFKTAEAGQNVLRVVDEVFSVDEGRPTRTPVTQLPPPTPLQPLLPPQALKLPSMYVSAQNPSDRLQLNTDNSFSLQEAGQKYRGTFAVIGNTVEIAIDANTKTLMTMQGNTLTDPSGQIWALGEQPAPTASRAPDLRNEDIIKLAKVGIDDATIIAKIESSKCQFDTSTDALIQLKQSGVSAAILKAMVGAGK